MVVKEAMRLHPPAWLLMTRTPLEPITVGGYPIHPGEWIFIAPYVMHRDPQYFEEPERFEPERFSEAREAELPRYAYFPFGGGQRVCIGNSFAMMEARLILATMAQRCRLALVPGQQIIPEPEITLSSRYGLQMTVSMREAVP
jgi:cytochrome P450